MEDISALCSHVAAEAVLKLSSSSNRTFGLSLQKKKTEISQNFCTVRRVSNRGFLLIPKNLSVIASLWDVLATTANGISLGLIGATGCSNTIDNGIGIGCDGTATGEIGFYPTVSGSLTTAKP